MIKVGSIDFDQIKVGINDISEVRIGTLKIWPRDVEPVAHTLAIGGPDTVNGETATFSAIYDKTSEVTSQAIWSIASGSQYATMSGNTLTVLSGASHATVTIQASYGGLTETKTITVTYVSGSSSETETQTEVDPETGEETTTTTTVVTNEDGSSEVVISEVKYDSEGNVIGSTDKTTINNADGSSSMNSTTIDADGSSQTTNSQTNADGRSGTSTTTNFDPDGNELGHETSNTDTSGNVSTQIVEKDEDGNDVVTGYTIDTSESDDGYKEIDDSVDTGFVPFRGNNWELNFRFKYRYGDNIGVVAVPISASKWVDGVLKSGFALRLNNPKRSSGQYNYWRPFITHIDNGSTESEYLYITSSRGAVFDDDVEFYIHMTKMGSTITFEITADSIKYNPTGTSTSKAVTETNSTRSLTWTDSSASEIDLKIAGQLNSDGEVINVAAITVFDFNIANI